MVRSAAGREYRSHTLKQGKDDFSVWTCLDCGALVGPLRRHRDTHDSWHARIEDIEAEATS